MNAIKTLFEKTKGYRTIIVGLIFLMAGITEYLSTNPFATGELPTRAEFFQMLNGLLMVIMRWLTTTPIFNGDNDGKNNNIPS